MYSYQGMPSYQLNTPSADWLDHVVSLDHSIEATLPGVGKIVAIQTSYDPEFGNPAWVYRFELRTPDGRIIPLRKDCVCMGVNPLNGLLRGFERSARTAREKCNNNNEQNEKR